METLVFLQIGLLLSITLAVALLLAVYNHSRVTPDSNEEREPALPAGERQISAV